MVQRDPFQEQHVNRCIIIPMYYPAGCIEQLSGFCHEAGLHPQTELRKGTSGIQYHIIWTLTMTEYRTIREYMQETSPFRMLRHFHTDVCPEGFTFSPPSSPPPKTPRKKAASSSSPHLITNAERATWVQVTDICDTF